MDSDVTKPLDYGSQGTERVKRDTFWERPNGWPMLTATVVAAVLLLIDSCDGQPPPGDFPVNFQLMHWALPMIVGFAWLVRNVQRLCLYQDRGAPSNARIGRITIAIPLILTAAALIAYFDLPMRVCFHATVTPGRPVPGGDFGFYRVAHTCETAPGEYFFQTKGSFFVGHAIGFTYIPNGQIRQPTTHPFTPYPRATRRSCTHITGNWYWTLWTTDP
jgi:hypothetical protein